MDKREKIFNKFNGRCAYCGCELDKMTYHIDHIVPKSKMPIGVNNTEENYFPACQDCNLAKSDLSIEEFREKIYSDLLKTFHGRMICKYFNVSGGDNLFYFERIKNRKAEDNGDL